MIADVLTTYAESNARVFKAREQTVGASDVGQCARKIFWLKNECDPVYGTARDPDFRDGWGARMRGTVFENYFWEPALRACFGKALLYAGSEQQTLVNEFLSATPDALLTGLPRDALAVLGVADIGGDRSLVVECKTADPRTNLDEAKPEHVFQAQVQLGLFRELTPHRPAFALISYTNASFWHEITEFPIAFDPDVFATAKRRAALIMTARAADDLKPEGWIAGGRECEFCPFTRACGRKRHEVPTQANADPDPQFVAEIVDLARALKHEEHEAKAASARLRELQTDIRERLRSRGTPCRQRGRFGGVVASKRTVVLQHAGNPWRGYACRRRSHPV